MLKKWAYKIITYESGTDSADKICNKLGEDFWEHYLVTEHQLTGKDNIRRHYLIILDTLNHKY